jgi:hypothetical protein
MQPELEQIHKSLIELGYKFVAVKVTDTSMSVDGDYDLIPYLDIVGYSGKLEPYNRTTAPMTVKQFEELKEVWAKIEAAAPPIPDITH